MNKKGFATSTIVFALLSVFLISISILLVTLDMFYKFTNSDEQALKDQMRGEAEKRVKYRFMLEEIASLEKIEIDDKEAEKEIEDLSKKYNTPKEELLKQIGGIEMIKYDLKMQKVLDIMKK